MDVTQRLRKAREELVRFEHDMHEKTLERQKLTEHIQEVESKIREIRLLEQDLRMTRSRLGRLDIELARLNAQRRRLGREVPNLEIELQKSGLGGRFRKVL